MVRPLRFQYPGAVYQVMARGDGGKVVFETDDDRLVFLKRLEETCASSGWRVHAWVVMDNHFHLLQVDKSKGVKARKRSRSECVGQDHGEKEVERLIRQCAPHLGLP
jgi:REP element-mobilizing transposase RayT